MTSIEACQLPTWWLTAEETQSLWFLRCGEQLAIAASEPHSDLLNSDIGNFSDRVRDAALPCFELNTPVALSSVEIDKSWGLETWLTGMEQRGVAIAHGLGGSVPLPWLLAGATEEFTGCPPEQLLLLKFLRSGTARRGGDLYLELHRFKQEVYVVTDIDRQVWPDGVGEMLLGVSPVTRAAYRGDAAFRQAAFEALQLCERLQREVTTASSDAERHQLQSAIAEARRVSEEFMAVRQLRPGDVVEIPPETPHCLRRGVEVLEVQSPVYERLVLSHDRPLVNQVAWDSQEATRCMRLDAPAPTRLQCLWQEASSQLALLADNPEFTVERLELGPGCCFHLTVDSNYALLVSLHGQTEIDGQPCVSRHAHLMPSRERSYRLRNCGSAALVMILTHPRVPAIHAC